MALGVIRITEAFITTAVSPQHVRETSIATPTAGASVEDASNV
jgi:hypothetical protein